MDRKTNTSLKECTSNDPEILLDSQQKKTSKFSSVSMEAHSPDSSVIDFSKRTSYNSQLEINFLDREEIELISFRQWHQRMQKEHETMFGSQETKYGLWDWCNQMCSPCSTIDSTDFNGKFCKCCKYRTFKSWTTGIIISLLIYIILYELLGNDVLPGGTYFIILIMFVVAFVAGNLCLVFGLPTTVGQLFVGIFFGNLPIRNLPPYDEHKTLAVLEYSEKIILVLVIIRAGLQIDFAKIRGHVRFIMQFALCTFCSEFFIHMLGGHFLLQLPWEWSALMGSILSPVSLSTVVSIIEKNKKFALGQNKIAPILIAASSMEIILCFYSYSICISIIFSKGVLWGSSWWTMLIAVIIQIGMGFFIGVAMGFIAGMFPDRRSPLAPYIRILFIGISVLALVLSFHNLRMSGVGVLSAITMVFIATNVWGNLGWHESSNPVLYFYALIYFFAQPVGVSLVGFTIRFNYMNPVEVGLTISVILIALAARIVVCFLTTFEKDLFTTLKEKIFICITWLPKGAVEALLAAILRGLVQENFKYLASPNHTLEDLLSFSKTILQAAVLGILITSPLATSLAAYLGTYLLSH